MKSQALQDMIRKIYNNEKSREEFMANPDKFISRMKLTEEEKKAVLNTQAKLGLVTSNSQQLEESIDPTWTWSAPTP